MVNREHSDSGEAFFQKVADCPFCGILSGRQEGVVLRRTDQSAWILSLEGHPLIVPVDHVTVDALTAEDFAVLAREAGSYIGKIKDFYNADGLNLHMSWGRSAGQEIEHAHLHLIPRFKHDQAGRFPKNLTRRSRPYRLKLAAGFRGLFVEHLPSGNVSVVG